MHDKVVQARPQAYLKIFVNKQMRQLKLLIQSFTVIALAQIKY